MKEINHASPVTCSDMQSDMQMGQTIEGLPVLRDLEGPICTYCGNRRYFLVFRMSEDGRNGILEGRCSCCRTLRELTTVEIEEGIPSINWVTMDTNNRLGEV
jgi:hypothetical protein